jgi:type IV secretion system protein VirB6
LPIVVVATNLGMFGRDLHESLTEDVKGLIAHVVTGKDEKPEMQIDKSLAWMQVALSSIDGIKILNDSELQADKAHAMWFNGLGPLFILCLLLDQTK